MLEKMIIEHCAPTLAGIKTANMFSFKFSSVNMLYAELKEANQKLNPKGVYIEILTLCSQRALIYVYRRQKLQEDLADAGVKRLLWWNGYRGEGGCCKIDK